MRFIFSLLMLVPLASMATPTEPEVAWSKKEVTVCFGDNTHKRFSAAISLSGQFADFSDKEKKAIKSIITQEYTSETTGISFVGWEDCQPDVINADVVLLRPDLPDSRESGAYTEVGGVATIGERGWLTKRVDERTQKEVDVYVKWPQDLPRKNVITISTKQAQSKKVGAEKYIQMLALHEFGHTAGLGHQHLRKEAAKADPNCKYYEDMLKKSTRDITKSAIFTSKYDYNSVMNYCYLNKIFDSVGTTFRTKHLEKVITLPDATLYSKSESKNIFGKTIPGKFTYKVKIGLSALDKHALKCLYVYDKKTRDRDCNVGY